MKFNKEKIIAKNTVEDVLLDDGVECEHRNTYYKSNGEDTCIYCHEFVTKGAA